MLLDILCEIIELTSIFFLWIIYFFKTIFDTDKQSPAPVNCTEEQEFVVFTSSVGTIPVDSCDFHDNVIGEISGTFENPRGTNKLPAGDYNEMYFKADDNNGNEAKVQQRILIHGNE